MYRTVPTCLFAPLPQPQGDLVEKLNKVERTAYVLGLVLCIIGDAIHDAWVWLQCPAPDQPQPMENPSSISNKAVTAIAIVAILATIASLSGLWIFSPTR